MDLLSNKTSVINSNISNNNNNKIDNHLNNNNINSYSMPSTTTTESFGNIGGLTQTTPTLTPTTLKNIEESFMEIIPPQPQQHQHQAGFVPPLVNISSTYTSIHGSNLNNLNNDHFINNMSSNSNNSNSNNSDFDYGSDYETDDSSSKSQSQWNAFIDRNNGSANLSENNNNINNNNNNKGSKLNGTKTRGTSGRKPLKNDKLTPEEEKKRQQRRERNKQAAARCRKRRMDHTNCLLIETDGLEEKKQALQSEIEMLRSQKEELEYILETHKTTMSCKLNSKVEQMDIKPVVSNGNIMAINVNGIKSRPNSLPISCVYGSVNDTGIPIQTPSTGLFLDSIEGGTGLTPILNAGLTPSTLIITPSTMTSTTCGVQLRSSSSPSAESPGSKKLVHL